MACTCSLQTVPMAVTYKGLITFSMIVALGAAGILGPLGTDMYLPAFPHIAEDLNTSAAQVQFTLSAFTIGMASGQLILGALSDKFGRRKILLAGTATMFISAVVSANSSTILGLAIGCAVMGFSASSGLVVGRAVVSDLSSGREAVRIFSILGLIGGIGPIAGPLAGALAMGAMNNWRGIFWLLAAFSLIILFLIFFLIPETLSLENRHTGGVKETFKTFAAVLSNKNYLFNSMTLWFGFGLMFAYISASPFILQSILGFSPLQFTAAFAVNGMGLVISGFITSRISQSWEPSRIIRIGITLQITMTIALLVIALTGSLSAWLILPAMFFLASSMGFVFGPVTALALREVRKSGGTALAISGAMQFLCAAFAAPLVGLGGKDAILPFAIVAGAYASLALTGHILANLNSQRIFQASPAQ